MSGRALSPKQIAHAAQEWDLSHFPIELVVVARENNLLYDNFGIANSDDVDLAVSIRDNGIQEPLTLTADSILLSGHRRLAAAKYLGLETVPVRVAEDVVFSDLTETERLETLRLHNQQRDKSPGERIREKLVDIDPARAHSDLLRRRVANFTMRGIEKPNVELGDRKQRARITTMEFLEAAQRVIQENEEYWTLTDRRVHYLLLNDPPLRHDAKPGSRYANDKPSYKALTNLLLRARLTGDIPFEAIEDSTRPIQLGGGFSTFEEFVAQETENFLMGYSRNLMQGQPHHIEIMLEKNALRTVIESVAREYNIPITTGRGFASLSPRYDLFTRFKQSGKTKLVLLMLTDFDPDGEEIAASFARSLRDDFGIKNIHPVKVALTAQDVIDNDLPSDMDAKVSSPNYQKFIQKYGTKVVELDAAPVKLLQSKLREAIRSVIDVDEFNAQVELEKADAANIEAHRRVVFDAINGPANKCAS
ncbi:MAG: ParB N-terminal domain-containing protein [Betaproteobacteria bacterium]|nr:ParB N-terminal domain-containing protein [Betaproteobacteria bacterium]